MKIQTINRPEGQEEKMDYFENLFGGFQAPVYGLAMFAISQIKDMPVWWNTQMQDMFDELTRINFECAKGRGNL